MNSKAMTVGLARIKARTGYPQGFPIRGVEAAGSLTLSYDLPGYFQRRLGGLSIDLLSDHPRAVNI